MPRIPSWKNSQIMRRLVRLGFSKIGESKHGIVFLRQDEEGKQYLVRVPKQPHKACAKRTFDNIIRNFGFTREQLLSKKKIKKLRRGH